MNTNPLTPAEPRTVPEALAGLDDGQRAAALWRPDRFNVLFASAMPGSGKSSTAAPLIVNRVLELPPNLRLLAPSHTNQARRELLGKLAELVPSVADRCDVVTFETLERRLVLEVAEVEASVAAAVPGGRIRFASRGIEVSHLVARAGRRLIALPEEYGFCHAYLHDQVAEVHRRLTAGRALDPVVLDIVGPAWEELRVAQAARGRLLSDGVRHLVSRHREHMFDMLARRYGFIVIDEAQDTAAFELDLFLTDPSVLAVAMFGDAGQAIMRFRGAVGDVEAYLKANGIAYELIWLAWNYRSTPMLVRAQNSLRAALGIDQPPAKAATRGR